VLGLEQVGDQSVIGIHDNFFDLGGHSLLMVKVRSKLEQILNSNLSMVDLFKYPTISSLAEYLSQGQDGQSLFLGSDYQVKELAEGKNRLMALSGRFSGLEIAIIGMGGRFPGAKNLDEYWQNLSSGVESITLFSDEELVAWGIESALLDDSNYVKARPVLEGVEYFDASFFGFTPREAEILDPQHRFFLECAWKTLEDAGYDAEKYRDSIGLYAGVGMNAYMLNNLVSNRHLIKIDDIYQAFIGSDKDFLPTRTSYKLNLKGPSVAVQTACSTSLVAIHLACRGLLGGECRMALAGGVTIVVPQRVGYLYQEGGISSPDGHCRAFDAKAQGTVLGSGVGIVVLKRLADAIVDGDCIHAIIKGSAINNDGSSKIGYTAPSVAGQSKVIRMAQIMAEVDAETIGYVETHGTGTSLGDPIEIEALTQAFRASTNRKGFCAIGSAKTNVGHLDAAAGVAGLIKTVLSLKHKQIAPSLHFEQPNPQIDFENSPFYVNTELREWKVRDGHPRRAGVSSFGIGGTNAHVILEEAPVLEPSGSSRSWQLLLLSAKTDTALETATTNLVDYLRQYPDLNLADVAYTLQVGRKAFDYRRIAVCQDLEEAASVLETNSQTALVDVQTSGGRPVVFMFTGQGSQYVNMGLELYQSEPVFQETVDQCCELLESHLGLELREILYPSEDRGETAREQLEQTAMTQPALFVIEYALAQLWMSWGVKPAAMIGHSIGEYVAACLAGVLSLEDALLLVAARGRLMQQLPGGSMVAVFLPEEEVLPLLGEELSLAAVNGPASCVVSGPTEVIGALEQRFQKQDVEYRRLHTLHAFHSAMMDPILESFAEQVKSAQLNPPEIPYVSNVSGTWVTSTEVTEPGYWAQHLRQTVRFFEGIGELLGELECVLLEIGPGKTLISLSQQHPRRTMGQIVVASLRHPKDERPDQAFLMEALGQLWLAGVELDWEGFYAGEQRRRVSLPTYPFERQRYWIEPIRERDAIHAPQVSPEKKLDIERWFHIPSWKRSVPLRAPDPEALSDQGQRWLMFMDDGGLGTRIAERLERANQKVIRVLSGEEFRWLDERLCVVNPRSKDDYHTLLKDLRVSDKIPDQIVHLWSLEPERDGLSRGELFEATQDKGFYSLLFLTQALGKQAITQPIRLSVVSDGVQAVYGESLHPEKATLLGPCKVIPQEYTNVICRNIDLVIPEPGSWQEERLVEQIIAELAVKSSDLIVAYRDHHRWVETFEAIKLGAVDEGSVPLRKKGVYLITGGLGEIGLTLARYLAKSVQARLVLTGRSGLPPRTEWNQWLAERDGDGTVSARIKAVQKLEELGAKVLVVGADVANEGHMRATIAQTQGRFGEINGVIHAAGIIGESAVREISEVDHRHCELHFRPKVYGLYVLEKILEEHERSLDFCFLLSSLSTVLGGLGFAAYASANIFMDAFVHQHNKTNHKAWISVDWDGATPEETVEAFRRILALGPMSRVVVSSRDLLTNIDKWVKLTALRDRESEEGAEPASLLNLRPNLPTPYVPPGNEVERKIADVWQELLGFEQVGIHDDFFQLGGSSLVGTQLISRLRREFQVEVPLRALFEKPTIANLVQEVKKAKGSGPAITRAPREIHQVNTSPAGRVMLSEISSHRGEKSNE
jgi:acyl transferase domain-containing protein/acyl carrier protein